MVVRVPQEGGSDITAIDFRETSPKKSEKEMYGSKKAGRAAAQVGGLAVGVPGELRGFEAGEFIHVLAVRFVRY
jgi:gamma-glutamyltranspeptidase/glutathione hydrolase/leukotriene-C4 hydrolase